jgi:hypothetical protein
MHGGARGSGGPRGDRNGNFKHGLWTVENVQMRKAVSLMIRHTRALLQELKSARVDPAAQRKAAPATFSRSSGGPQEGHRTVHRSGSAVGGSPHGMLLPCWEVRAARVQGGQPTVAVRPDAWGRISISDHPPLALAATENQKQIIVTSGIVSATSVECRGTLMRGPSAELGLQQRLLKVRGI